MNANVAGFKLGESVTSTEALPAPAVALVTAPGTKARAELLKINIKIKILRIEKC